MSERWVITGASRGIGLMLARRLISSGARVAMLARSSDIVEQARNLSPERALGICADVTDGEAVDVAIDKIVTHWGGVDVLVNNAGLHRGGLIGTLPVEHWSEVIDANLTGPFRLIRRVHEEMKPGSCIVNIGAVVGSRGFSGDVAYGASKAGLAGLTRVLAVELARRGIRVNLVIPGFVFTAITEQIDERAKDRILKRIPMRRPGEEAEIAETIEWVARATYMTGATIPVDGGLSCNL